MHEEYAGAFHIHSKYSDGTGSIPEITEAAKQAGLDFIVLGDHNTWGAKEDFWEGWHRDVLVVCGNEVSPSHSHFVALGCTAPVDRKRHTPVENMRIVKEAGGTAIIAHACQNGLLRQGPAHEETEIVTERLFGGIEIWSYMHDWIDGLTPFNLVRRYRNPDRTIMGPLPRVLARWDSLMQRQRIFAVGALDVHARRLPPVVPFTNFFPYAFMFTTIRTHVLCEPMCGHSATDLAHLYDALRECRAFIAYDALANSRGFRFELRTDDGVRPVGAETAFAPGQVLQVRSPSPAELSLVKDGRTVVSTSAHAIEHEADSPGVYRVEARREGRPWVFTNAIYLRPA